MTDSYVEFVTHFQKETLLRKEPYICRALLQYKKPTNACDSHPSNPLADLCVEYVIDLYAEFVTHFHKKTYCCKKSPISVGLFYNRKNPTYPCDRHPSHPLTDSYVEFVTDLYVDFGTHFKKQKHTNPYDSHRPWPLEYSRASYWHS